MHERPTDIQSLFATLAERAGPVISAVISVFCVIVGVLVIRYPELLAWAVGISLVLAGVALFASVLASVAASSR